MDTHGVLVCSERVISHICPHQWIDESGEIFPCPSAYCDPSSLWRHRKNAHYWNAEDTDEQVAIPTPVPEKKKRRQNARTRTDPLPVLEKEPRRIGRAKTTPRPKLAPSTSLLDDVTLITLKEEPVSQSVPQASVGTAVEDEIDFGFNSLPSTSSHLPSQFQLKSEDINFILNQVASGSDFEPVVPAGPSQAPDVQTLVELKQWMLDPPQPAVTFDNANYGYAYSAQFAQAYGATTLNPSALMLPAPAPAPVPALSPYEQGLMMYAAGNDMAAPYLPSRESSASPLGEHGMYDNAWVPDPVALDEFQRLLGFC